LVVADLFPCSEEPFLVEVAFLFLEVASAFLFLEAFLVEVAFLFLEAFLVEAAFLFLEAFEEENHDPSEAFHTALEVLELVHDQIEVALIEEQVHRFLAQVHSDPLVLMSLEALLYLFQKEFLVLVLLTLKRMLLL